MRLIDADALFLPDENSDKVLILGGRCCNGKTVALATELLKKKVDDAPTIDPESLRKKGEWVVLGDADYQCSQCGFRFTSGDPITKFPYCRCGADMRKEAHNEC